MKVGETTWLGPYEISEDSWLGKPKDIQAMILFYPMKSGDRLGFTYVQMTMS
jgi:hypothetical protein